ncbi:hypothetical protein OT109_15315 [Phycisphaeraceae bacterium D3-23]
MSRRLAPLLFAFAAFALLLSAAYTAPALAQDGRPVAHAFFVAGPSFTGIIDEHGETQWAAPRTHGARDGFVLDSGHILITYGNEVVEFDNDKEIVWRYTLHESNGEISTAQRLDNGNTLISELGGNARLLEVTPEGEIAVELATQPDTDNVHMQTRMARKLENGNYIAPHLLGFDINEYDADGNIVASFHTDTEHFGGRDARNWPFTAIRTPEGTTVVGCTYGNRVVEFDAEGEVLWQVTNDDVGGIIKDACGVQRLPNGNTVIACYGARDGVKLFEVNADKEIVWQYAGPHNVHHFQILTTNGEPLPGDPMK